MSNRLTPMNSSVDRAGNTPTKFREEAGTRLHGSHLGVKRRLGRIYLCKDRGACGRLYARTVEEKEGGVRGR